jgi:diaminopimelate decarboxylase
LKLPLVCLALGLFFLILLLIMDYFNYKKGTLFAEDVPVATIAEQVGTPVYIYSKTTFLEHLTKTQKAFSGLDTTVCYSVKACGNINILKFIARNGFGFDIVSGGELYRAMQAGADPGKIVYAGVGKTDKEMSEALDANIGYFNIESEAELENLIRISTEKGKIPKAALRVNPDVDPKTHTYTTTGLKETKFGVDIERAEKVFEQFGKNPAVKLCAIHIHLGSAGHTVGPYVEALNKTLTLVDSFVKRASQSRQSIQAAAMGPTMLQGNHQPPRITQKRLSPCLKIKI